jgi:hypothetical protein
MDPCFSCTERMQVVDVRSGKIQVLSSEELEAMARRKLGRAAGGRR